MNPTFAPSASELLTLTPEIGLVGGGVLLLLAEAFLPRWRRAFFLLALAAVGWAAWQIALTPPAAQVFGGLVSATPLTLAFAQIVLLATGLGIVAAQGYLVRERVLGGEYYALLLWCSSGLLLLVRASELLTLFLALEVFSLCLYSLAAFHRRLVLGSEAAAKYFLMGAFVSAFVLYGIALIYGETGSTRLAEIGERLSSGVGSPGLLALGLLLVLSGFAFKMSLVPFHAWSPDVYQGAPSPFVAYLSVAPKVGSVLVVIHLLEVVQRGGLAGRWSELVALLSIASMVGGNLLALVQRDLKRMLAYSGVAHMGYLLIPLVAFGPQSASPVLVYLVAYALMNIGAFTAVSLLYGRPDEQHQISELSGWGYRYPFVGLCLTVCLISLGGLPPTAGFLGKYFVFLHAIEHGQLWLALVGVAASLIGIFYYLRVVYVLYMKPQVREPQGLRVEWLGRLAVGAAAIGSLALGIWPARLFDWVARALQPLS